MRSRSGFAAMWVVGSAIVLAAWLLPATTTAKTGQMGSFGGVTVAGSPYRYAAFPPRTPGNPTTVARIARDGGQVSRWWSLPGSFLVPAVAAGPDSGGGLSADGETLVLSGVWRSYPPRVSRFAVLKTLFNYEWHGPGQPPHFRRFPKFIDLPGAFSFNAISPDGATVYLNQYRRHGAEPNADVELGSADDFEIRALDVESGKLAPRPLAASGSREGELTGLPLTRASSGDGRWTYTLQLSDRGAPYLLILDTVAGRAIAADLPQLRKPAAHFPVAHFLRLRLEADGRRLTVFSRDPDLEGARPLLRIDTSDYTAQPARSDTASIGAISWLSVEPASRDPLLAFAQTPRHPGNLLLRVGPVGHSSGGRAIGLRQSGDPAIEGELLVFGCIHGDECAGRAIRPVMGAGCPDPASDVFLVPNLNPDGFALGSRLNGHGVDLNRNFPAGWKPIGQRGDPQYSGPHPFSEPETRLAARIVRQLEPEVTIWFHQHDGSRAFVRAWAQSAPAARQFARLSQLPFHLLPWPAGTAPNWQNHRFPGTSSFVVELPAGTLDHGLRARLDGAVVRLGRKVGED
jgi:protein MpaA